MIYGSEIPEQKRKEAEGLERIFRLLPEGKAKGTPDSRFAKAIDRIPLLLHHVHWRPQLA